MTQIPLIASVADLPEAIQFAQRRPTSRWFVAARAEALGQAETIPEEWGITASMAVPHISAAEKKVIDEDVADGKENELPAKIKDPDDDGDDDLVASEDTDHDGAAYRKKLGLAAALLASAIDFDALIAGGYYSDYGVEDAFDEFDLDSELPESIVASASQPFTAEQRRKYASQGVALSDGSFPIPNKRYLKKAIRAVGRSSHPASTVRAHIRKRAKALGATSLLPDSYGPVTASTSVEVSDELVARTALEANKQTLRAQVASLVDSGTKEALRERVNRGKASEPTAITAGRHSLAEDVEHAGHDFEEALHPRGKDGEFISKGGRVVADDGAGHKVEGTVESFHRTLDGGTQVAVKTDQGHTVLTSPSHISEAPKAVASLKPETSAPHTNPTTAVEHLDNAQFHTAQATKHLNGAERTSGAAFEAHTQAAAQHREAAVSHRDQARAMLNQSAAASNEKGKQALDRANAAKGASSHPEIVNGVHQGTPEHRAKLAAQGAERKTLDQLHEGDQIVNVSNGKRTRITGLAPSGSGKDYIKMTLDNGEETHRHKSTTYNVLDNYTGSPEHKQAIRDRVKSDLTQSHTEGHTPGMTTSTATESADAKAQRTAIEAEQATRSTREQGILDRAGVKNGKVDTAHDAKPAPKQFDSKGQYTPEFTAHMAQRGLTPDGTPLRTAAERERDKHTIDARDSVNGLGRNHYTDKSPKATSHGLAPQEIEARAKAAQETADANRLPDQEIGKYTIKETPHNQHMVERTSSGHTYSVHATREEAVGVATARKTQDDAEHTRITQATERTKNLKPSDIIKPENHQEQVVEHLKRMGYTDRTAKGARNLTSKDKNTRIKVNDDGTFGMKVNNGNGVYSARNHGVDTSGDAHSVASALHEAGRTAPAVKPHAGKPAGETAIDRARQAAQDRHVRVSNANVAKDEEAARKVAPVGTVPVYNTETGKVEHVSPNEATAGHVRYGQSLGAGTPAAGQTVKNALDAKTARERTPEAKTAMVDHAEQMFGSDRSKWTKAQLGQAASLGDTKAATELRKREAPPAFKRNTNNGLPSSKQAAEAKRRENATSFGQGANVGKARGR